MIILTNQTKIIIIKKSTCENRYTLEHIDLKSKGINHRKHKRKNKNKKIMKQNNSWSN